MTDERLTQEQIHEMFGGEMPLEAVQLLFSAPDDMPVIELRKKLNEIAEKQRGREWILDGPVMHGVDMDIAELRRKDYTGFIKVHAPSSEIDGIVAEILSTLNGSEE